MDLNVLAVYPHAHYLAKLIEGYATLPDGSKKWLIRIPDWDLNWQGVFRYKNAGAPAQGLGGDDAASTTTIRPATCAIRTIRPSG